MMVVNHLRNIHTEDIRMNESQLLEMMNNCRRCHTSEYAKWAAGGHAITYSEVFLDSIHNSTEQLNFDCLRCHGMFYEGIITNLAEPLSVEGPWSLRDDGKKDVPTILCASCHPIHTDGNPIRDILQDNYNLDSTHYAKVNRNSSIGFYDRAEKTNYPAKNLPKLTLFEGDTKVNISDDLAMRNCVQCHAPNSRHEAGTNDDRTPRGVHEGLSCMACHEPHSNDVTNSCVTCHPAISNCNIDVTLMNTSYVNPNSLNNIHFVSCADCHNDNRVISK
jgi:hypothetical protein